MKYLFLVTLFALVGCASNKLKELDTTIDPQGSTVNGGVIGIQDERAVIQEKRTGEEELRLQIWRNYQLENDLNHEYHMTQWCYEDLADPRLGGNGEVADAPDMKKLKNSVAVKEEIGLEDKRLVVVKTSSFNEQLAVERQYEKAMSEMIREVKKTRGNCERKMGVARVKAGLPSKRYQGKAVINKQGNVQEVIKEHEHTLDDAFRIKEAVETPKASDKTETE